MGKMKFSFLVLKIRQVHRLRGFYGLLDIEVFEEQHRIGTVHFAG